MQVSYLTHFTEILLIYFPWKHQKYVRQYKIFLKKIDFQSKSIDWFLYEKDISH